MVSLFVPYSATALSVIGRGIFIYLLYTKKSTNTLSLLFCALNVISSGLWIQYSSVVHDQPIFIRSMIDVVLFSASSGYILYNKRVEYMVRSRIDAEPLGILL